MKTNLIRHLTVPSYENLSLADFLRAVSNTPGATDYFPEQRDWRRLPRQWIINLRIFVLNCADDINI